MYQLYLTFEWYWYNKRRRSKAKCDSNDIRYGPYISVSIQRKDLLPISGYIKQREQKGDLVGHTTTLLAQKIRVRGNAPKNTSEAHANVTTVLYYCTFGYFIEKKILDAETGLCDFVQAKFQVKKKFPWPNIPKLFFVQVKILFFLISTAFLGIKLKYAHKNIS